MTDDEDDSEPRLGDLIRRAFDRRLASVRVSLPAKVLSYDDATRTASVQCLIADVIELEDGEREARPLPVINGVPIMFSGSGGARIRFPIVVGSTVWCVFASSALDRMLVRGGSVDPKSNRHHHANDAWAMPFAEADRAHISDNDVMIEFTDEEIFAGGEDSLALRDELNALADYVDTLPVGGTGSAPIPGGAPQATGTTVLKGG